MSNSEHKPASGAKEVLERYQSGQRALQHSRCWRAKLPGACLEGADLSHSDFLYAELSGANLRGAKLEQAQLEGADLTGANLSQANLQGALASGNFSNARLGRARLGGAVLRHAVLKNTDLTEAHLHGADLSEAVLTDVRLYGALYDTQTRWPKGFDPMTLGAIDASGDGPVQHSAPGPDHRSQDDFERLAMAEPLAEMSAQDQEALAQGDLVMPLWHQTQNARGTVKRRQVGALALGTSRLAHIDGNGTPVRAVLWSARFGTQLTAWPNQDGQIEVGVQLSVRRQDNVQRLRFKTTLPPQNVHHSVQIVQAHAGHLPAEDFARVWPWIVFHAGLHGQELRGLLRPPSQAELDSTQ